MNRTETIKMLEYIKHTGNGENEYKNCRQGTALDMAIKVLEQQTCEDCRYNTKPRHAVCNSCICGDRYVRDEGFEELDEGFEELDFVPPHKKIKVNLVPCEDAVSRAAVLDEIFESRKNFNNEFDQGFFADKIRDLPPVNPQPKTEACEDAVSRNLITQTLNKMDRYVAEELTLCDTDKKFPKNEVFIVDDVYEQIVEQLPSVQSAEQKVGYWIEHNHGLGTVYYQCSICKGYDGDIGRKGRFCKWCGAKMIEPKESENKE